MPTSASSRRRGGEHRTHSAGAEPFLLFGSFRGGPRGKPLEVRLLGPSTDAIKPLAERLKAKLVTDDGVFDIQDEAAPPGNLEVKVTRKPGAENIGGVFDVVARQLRDAFYGNESLKVERDAMRWRSASAIPNPAQQPLGPGEHVNPNPRLDGPGALRATGGPATGPGYSTLRRVSGKSVITVSADVNEDRANAEDILRDLKESGFFADLMSSVPGARLDLRGQRQQIFESLDALLLRTFPVGLLGIYTVLAGIFRSYVQPVIIMVAIPFGLIGAVIGHYLMGFDVTLLSLFGMVALTGIVGERLTGAGRTA